MANNDNLSFIARFKMRHFCYNGAVVIFCGAIWLINSIFLFHWAFKIFAVIEAAFAIIIAYSLVRHFICFGFTNKILIFPIIALFTVLMTSLLHLDTMRFGYLMYEIGPLIMLLFVLVKKDFIKNTVKRALSAEYCILMTLAAISTLVFERNGFADRAHIMVLPNLSLNSNIYSYPLVLAIILEAMFVLQQKKKGFTLLSAISIAVMLGVVMFMRSRGAFVALSISCAVLLLYESKSKIRRVRIRASVMVMVLLLVVLMLMVIVLKNNKQSGIISDSGRFDLWKIAVNRWKSNVLWGAGNGQNYVDFLTSHNWFLDILSQFGLVFFVAYICIFLRIAKMFVADSAISLMVFSFIQSLIDCGSMTQVIAMVVALIIVDRKKRNVFAFYG